MNYEILNYEEITGIEEESEEKFDKAELEIVHDLLTDLDVVVEDEFE